MSVTKATKDAKQYLIDLKELSGHLQRELLDHIDMAWQADQDILHLDILDEGCYLVAARILDIGNKSATALLEGKQNIAFYNISYNWANEAKAFLTLWRNIVFEEQKALLLVSEGRAKMDSYQALKNNSKAVLITAANDILGALKKHLKNSGGSASIMQKLSLQDNPWSVYKQQIASLAPQTEALVKQFKTLWNASGLYVLVKSNFDEEFDIHQKSVEEFKKAINEISASLEFTEKLEVNEVVKQLNTLSEKHLSDRSFQELQKILEADLKELPKSERYVIQKDNGKLYYEDIDLKQRTGNWLESEMLPLINNFYSIRANTKNQFNLSLSNIKNRLSKERNEGGEYDKSELLNALNTFVKRLDKSEQQIVEIRREVHEQFNQFAVHKIYDGNYLNLSIASTLNQYNRSSMQRFKGVKKWIADKGIFVKQFQDSVEQEERLSLSEKLVRVINARKPQSGSDHYNNMFMTRGFIGTSFMVGRSTELAHIKSIIDNWQVGFRGAVMITGTRFSGKSSLAEVISQRHFSDKTIKLVAGKKLQVGGRHLDPTMSLHAQLEFVVKYSLQDKVLIYLDDLHQWHNEEFTLLENIRSMSKIIDKYSNKLFFMVCINNWQKDRFNSVLNLDSIFQAEINTDKVSLDDLQKAILIRHSATHTELVNGDGEDLGKKSIHNILKSIYNITNGNIGESLIRWARDIKMYADDKVQYQLNDYGVPQFLNPSSSILLKSILMYGATNEYHLRRIFGPAFQDEYKPILQRLINVGVIERNVNGKLEIRTSIVNDIAALLASNTAFTYLKKSNTQ